MNQRSQPDPAIIFVHNLLDISSYYAVNGGQPQDLIDFFIHFSKPEFINKVYLELQNRFLKQETTPLCKLLIIHFFKYTQITQLMIESTRDYADNFVAFQPLKRWQEALEFRAVSNLIPTINEIANPLNPEIRSDTFSLMRMINGLESSDPEVYDSAKDVLQKLGKKITPFQNIYLQCIKMPFLLIFLPDMISNSEIVQQAITVYSSLFQLFLQKKMEFESKQIQNRYAFQGEEEEKKEQDSNQLSIIGDDDKNHYDILFDQLHPCQFLHDILVSLIKFIRNLKVFPRTLLKSIIDLFHDLAKQEEDQEKDHIISLQSCIMIFDSFSSFADYLRPFQIHIISDIAINFISNLPVEIKQLFTNNESNDPSLSQNSINESDKKFLKSPLKMLSRLKITDSRLTSTPPIDAESAALLVSVYPRPTKEKETDNSTYADQVVSIFRPFEEEYFSVSTCRLYLSHLIDFIPFLSEEAHSIIIEVLLPNLMKQGKVYQELIANFLSSISFLSNPDLLSLYLIFINEFPEGVEVAPRLKAVSLSLFYLAKEKPDENFARISYAEVFDLSKALFLIGEYKLPAEIWGSVHKDSSINETAAKIVEEDVHKGLISPAEAFQVLSSAELSSNANDHSKAAREFIRAADLFDLTSFPHDFHLFYLKSRHFFESICFQVELMNETMKSVSLFDQNQDIRQSEPISANICDINELQSNLAELEESSLLLHPFFDKDSNRLVSDFIETSNEMIAAIDQGEEAFETVINNRKIIPPPAILETEQPITVENVRIVNPDIEIKGSLVSRQFYLELRGNVRYNLKFFNKNYDKDEEEDENEDEKKKLELELEFFRETRLQKIENVMKSDDFYFENKSEVHSDKSIVSPFNSNYKRSGIEWCENNGMKLMCHISIPINGNLKPVHAQEIPWEGEFSVDFPIIAEYKEICQDGCKSDSGHNMRVTIFFIAYSHCIDNPKNDCHYRIGREERYVYIHEL